VNVENKRVIIAKKLKRVGAEHGLTAVLKFALRCVYIMPGAGCARSTSQLVSCPKN
jgi:hypothetical protein